MPRFEASVWIAAPVARVWAFHERDDVLDLLAPPHGKLVVLRREGRLEKGACVEFLVPIGPFRVPWVAVHTTCEPGRLFVDEQVRGPFRSWRHEHRMEPHDGGTLLTDRIDYSLPLHPVSQWLAGWAVRLQLQAMFAHRHRVTRAFCERRDGT